MIAYKAKLAVRDTVLKDEVTDLGKNQSFQTLLKGSKGVRLDDNW